jgi:hypothetical protein
MHNISNLFYFGTVLYMFRTVCPSIIRSLRLCVQHQVYVIQVLDSWWWTERPSETCRVLFQNKINLRYCAFGWFYYRNQQTHRKITTYLYIIVSKYSAVVGIYMLMCLSAWNMNNCKLRRADLSGSGHCPLADCCEYGNNHSRSMKVEVFIGYFSN